MRTPHRCDVETSRAHGPGSRRFYFVREALLGLACAGLAACGSAAGDAGAGGANHPAASPKLRAQERAVHAQVLAALHAPAPAQKPGIPRFIPKGTTINRVVTATAAHPALSIEGDSVWLQIPGGRTLATLVGPTIPYKLQGTAVPQTPVTFELQLTHTTGTVPLDLTDFKITDETGQIITPVITASHGRARPSATNGDTTLYLHTVLPVGSGAVNYNPGHLRGKARPLVAWDFDVETD